MLVRPLGLYAILDLPQRSGLAPALALEAMIEGGASVVQLRSKAAPLSIELVTELGRLCLARSVPLIINDDLELAERGIPGVAGVHLGQRDLHQLEGRRSLRPRKLALGISTHDLDQVDDALTRYDPDYLGFGPVFSTQSKQNPDPVVGLDGLTRACTRCPIPIVAIGGIDLARVPQVAQSGASAFAVISALAHADANTIRERAQILRQAFAP